MEFARWSRNHLWSSEGGTRMSTPHFPTQKDAVFNFRMSYPALLCSSFSYGFFLEAIWGIISVQSLSHVQLFVTPWTVARLASLSITNSWSLLKLTSIESVTPIQPSHPLSPPFSSCLQSFPASESFPRSQFFSSAGQSIGVSASACILPMNIQDGFPLELTGLISFQSKGLSRVFSSTTVQKHQFFGA